ncbi:CRISPR-associated endoribonuclease Cas6 [Aetokthonos hydrillicola Thurmond2011]|uniref:CRISPR-associated endoribonuclease Cas6 n=1 Tax=Aetokthonos hydrillicola Thurmond2011 TaxID=2712845 RepID=A0AAP5MBE9_9CYAN|nr:CRISPR-associated endoribonuclease Cas6 [Aetokthonos hydrillicola]MBO3458936.1 CRISPR-associated endoribonuclease Cas6 [Aetokthonos hydrillicola CCALA 1050]MBW4587213.1 CRISPR-associated endoribonuclease Cas6 [Aetokthonos hydrillicola CCALA 1050]MDR9896764.1 CRISPR-associated endoribonuclease Cas6 [Aetokthonos hydrillicola Thurmond2011]
MPHSLILNIIPQSPIYPDFLTGRHYHALFLTLVSSVDPELGDRLHSSNADKAFTLSPLQVPGNYRYQHKNHHTLQFCHQRPIPAGTSCWWRISLLDDTLFGKLTHLWLNLNPEQPWHLGSANLFITRVLGTAQSTQPWANVCSYPQLYEQASDRDRLITLSFATPVAFRQGGYDNLLPTRESVFNSLLSRWNKYSGIEFTTIPIEFLYPSFFKMHTEVISNYDNKFIGCIGEISYRILGDVEPNAIKQINALANFALYAGVGRKTTMGMGMTRRLSTNGDSGRHD